MRQQLLLLAAILCYAVSTTAQITVTNTSFFSANDVLYSSNDTSGLHATITPKSGVAQTWNFPLIRHTSDTLWVREANTGAAFVNFPSSTMRLPYLGGEAYCVKSATAVTAVGISGNFLGTAGGGTPQNIAIAQPFTIQLAPLHYNDKKTYKGSFKYTIAIASIPQLAALIAAQLPAGTTADSVRLNYTQTNRDTLDAFGALTVPAGTYQVLRNKQTVYTSTKIEVHAGLSFFKTWIDITSQLAGAGGGTGGNIKAADTTVTYSFVANTEKQAIAAVSMKKNKSVGNTRFLAGQTAVGTTDAAEAGRKLELRISPNPTADLVTVGINATDATNAATISVLDIVGHEVYRSTINGTAQQFNTANWRGGMYICTLLDARGNILASKSLQVMHP